MAGSRNSRFQVTFTKDGDGNVVATFDKLGQAAEDAGRKADAADAKWYKLGYTIGQSMKWAGGLAVAGIGLIIRNTIEAENQLAQLDAVLKSTGKSAEFSRAELVKLADGIAAASTFSGGEVQEAETRLLSYTGIVKENFTEALQIAIDQAARLGISVTQSAEIVGRALESPTKAAAALAQQGFGAAFTKSVRESIKALEDAGRAAEAQQIVIDILNESYQGAAAAARDTFGGAIKALKNSLEDLTTGSDGSFDGATKAVNELVDTLNDPQIKQGFDTLITGAANLTAELAEGITTIANYLSEVNRITQFNTGSLNVGNASYDQLTRRYGDLAETRKRLMQSGVLGSVRDLYSNNGTLGLSDLGKSTAQQLAAVEKEMQDILRRQAQLNRQDIASGIIWNPTADQVSPRATPAQPAKSDDKDKPKRARAAQLSEEEKAARSLLAALTGVNEKFNEEIALYGDSSRAGKLAYDLQHGSLQGLNDELARTLEYLDNMGQAQHYQSAQDAIERMLNTARALDAEDDFQAIYGPGGVFDKTADKAKETTDEMSEFARQAGRNMQDAFADLLFDPFSDGADDMLDKWLDVLRRMASEALAAKLFESLGSWGNANKGQTGNGGGSSWVGWLAGLASAIFGGNSGSPTGGGRAVGGPTYAGVMHPVNELGSPELYSRGGRTWLMDTQPGYVQPLLAPPSAAQQQQTMNIIAVFGEDQYNEAAERFNKSDRGEQVYRVNFQRNRKMMGG